MSTIEAQHQQKEADKEKYEGFKFISGVGIIRTTTLRNMAEIKNLGLIVKGAMQKEKNSQASSPREMSDQNSESNQVSAQNSEVELQPKL